MPPRKLPHLTDRELLRVCDMFIRRERVKQIVDWVNHQPGAEERASELTREQIYPLLNEARNRGFFKLYPPSHQQIEQRIVDLYRIHHEATDNPITVVNAEGPTALDHVAQEAAFLALSLIKNLGKSKKRVHIGLGAGFSTLAIARQLSTLIRAESSMPPITLHALSTGFRVDQPHIAPGAFFGLFGPPSAAIEYVGLFAPAMVKKGNYARVKQEPGVAESFAKARKIDLVITSLASAKDEHGALNQFLSTHGQDVNALRQQGWVGDVQYRPYTSSGPLSREPDIRAVTLFDLPDLVRLAETPNKYVVAVAAPCSDSGCGRTREDALIPLLTEPTLKVWTHVICDFQTGQKLIDLETSSSTNRND